MEEHVYETCSHLRKLKLITDDAEDFKGAPVNLQVVGRPFEDEKVLAAMQIIDEIVKS
jgi:Asp-tRNA(Asn)/Glu-tRNA(Gln) amidotransferase A subunit family amidase